MDADLKVAVQLQGKKEKTRFARGEAREGQPAPLLLRKHPNQSPDPAGVFQHYGPGPVVAIKGIKRSAEGTGKVVGDVPSHPISQAGAALHRRIRIGKFRTEASQL